MQEKQSFPEGQVGALYTVDQIVAEMLNDLNDYSTSQKQRLTGLCIPAIREVRLFHKASIQVAYPKINEAGIVLFPPDMIDYIQIGIPHFGKIHNLGLDNDMLLDRSTDCGEDARVMEPIMTSGPSIQYLNPNWTGLNSFNPTWYGTRSLKTAYYKVDETARRIQFNGRIPNGEIVLVYKSSGISLNTLIPAEMVTPIKNIVMYNKNLHNLSVPDNYKERLRVEKNEAIAMLRAFNLKFTMAQYKQVLYGAKRQTAKP
jgi:hypothetical protein